MFTVLIFHSNYRPRNKKRRPYPAEGASVHQLLIAGGTHPILENREKQTKSQPYFLSNACKTPLTTTAAADKSGSSGGLLRKGGLYLSTPALMRGDW